MSIDTDRNHHHGGWTPVCRLAQLRPERGAAALVDGEQVALFRVATGRADGAATTVFAVDHRDPVTGVNVVARGLVGLDGGRWYVASPLHKQRYDLATGRRLDGIGPGLRRWEAEIDDDGVVLVGSPRAADERVLEPRADAVPA